MGYLPTFGPCYVNLYGSTREYSDLPNKYEDLNLGKGEGVAYRGRVLLELLTHFIDEPEEDHKTDIEQENQLKVQKYMRRRRYVLHAVFMMATMVGDCDGPVQFEISLGNYGNILEDSVAPSASTTQPTNAIFDGSNYYFLPWGDKKPCTMVEAQMEDISTRLYALNMLTKLTSQFEQQLGEIKTGITAERSDSELAELAIGAIDNLLVGLKLVTLERLIV